MPSTAVSCTRGEQAGALEIMLDRVATYQEKTQSLKARVRKALTYPAAVIIVALIVSGVLLIEVVPQFQEIFSGFGADLPPFTLFVIRISEALRAWWPLACGGLVAAVAGLVAARRRLPGFRKTCDRLALKLPVLGGIVEKSAVARYARTLATTFAAGVPLIDALRSASGATGNTVYQQAVAGLRDSVSAGQPLYVSMRRFGRFSRTWWCRWSPSARRPALWTTCWPSPRRTTRSRWTTPWTT